MLSGKASAEAGPWRTERTPYLREIMDCLSPSSPVGRVVFMKGAQVGGSECGNNWLGFVIHHAPGPTMLVQPTVDTAKRFSKMRLAPMIEETPALRARIADSRSRDSGNTMMTKEFPGGILIVTGANSAVGLRSMPIRYLFLDEVDAYPLDVDGEGDPIQLAEKRTTTFSRRKILLVSTPTIKDVSRIEREYLASDQRRFFVPCPHCGYMQHLQWKNIRWENDDPATARYVCAEEGGCGVLIEERFKTQMLERGEWRATVHADGKIAGFHLSSLYSPLGWKSWQEIVAEFIEAKGDAPSLKTWVNTVLGETWEEEYAAKVGADGLQARVEFYEPGVAPEGVLCATAGVDVQDGVNARLAIVVTGWGEGEESWRIVHEEIFGDPAQPQVWEQLALMLDTEIEREGGGTIPISAVCIDSGDGNNTHHVYKFTRENKAKRWMAIKGQSQRNKPAIGKATKVDMNYRGQVYKAGAEVYPVGVDTIKSVIYGRLKFNQPGPGYWHFHGDLTKDYFDQLTAEKLITKYVRGFPQREWVKKSGARNEALDCEVYAYAALQWMYSRYNQATFWQIMRKKLQTGVNKEDQPPKKDNLRELQQAQQKASIAPRRPNWVNKW
ncbi:MAG TPA: phage terminase large subunit family protein [Acidocella sp.]|nr:phage terminase large subunit family protein [Acidocella sp.]